MTIKTQGTQKESKVLDTWQGGTTLQYRTEYDTLHPEETIRDFIRKIREMLAQYDYNLNRINEIEMELIDLEHYIEISDYKKVPDGYKLYRKQKDLRMERRARKSENELLKPVYECFSGIGIIGQMTAAQGKVRTAQSVIDCRVYNVKTHILDEFLDKPKLEKVGLNLLTGETCLMEG